MTALWYANELIKKGEKPDQIIIIGDSLPNTILRMK